MGYKYEMDTVPNVLPGGAKVYRIKALKDFRLWSGTIIYAGTLGGRIEHPHNLSQAGSCWIGYNAMALGNARVMADAFMSGSSRAGGNARLMDGATMKDVSRAYGNAWLTGDNMVMADYACAYGDARIWNSRIEGHARVSGTVTDALIGGEAVVDGSVCGDSVPPRWLYYDSESTGITFQENYAYDFVPHIYHGYTPKHAHNLYYPVMDPALSGTRYYLGVDEDNRIMLFGKTGYGDLPLLSYVDSQMLPSYLNDYLENVVSVSVIKEIHVGIERLTRRLAKSAIRQIALRNGYSFSSETTVYWKARRKALSVPKTV